MNEACTISKSYLVAQLISNQFFLSKLANCPLSRVMVVELNLPV